MEAARRTNLLGKIKRTNLGEAGPTGARNIVQCQTTKPTKCVTVITAMVKMLGTALPHPRVLGKTVASLKSEGPASLKIKIIFKVTRCCPA